MSDIFQKISGREIKVSLTTANKYMTKLKAHQSNEKIPDDPYGSSYRRGKKGVTFTASATTDVSNIFNKYVASETFILQDVLSPMEQELNAHFESTRDAFIKNRRIGWDISMIKNAIFSTNGVSGIDYILSKIDHLNSLKTEYQQLVKTLSGKTHVLASFAAFIKTHESGTSSDTMMDAWDKDELQKQVKDINKQINDLETMRDKLNATTDVVIRLSDESLEILGI